MSLFAMQTVLIGAGALIVVGLIVLGLYAMCEKSGIDGIKGGNK